MKKEEQSLETKHRLANALKKEMETKSFDKIHVSDLLKETDISRPTFYYYFEDIYSLMKWMFDTEAVDLLKKSEDCYTWDDGVMLLLEYIYQNGKICKCALSSITRPVLERFFMEDVSSILIKFVDSFEIPVQQKYKDFIIDFYTRAFVSSLVSWIKRDLKETPEEMLHLLDIAMGGTIKTALEKASKA